MEPQAVTTHTVLPWKHCIHLTLLLVQLSLPAVEASCRILKCNSDFVAATLDLSGAGAAGAGAGVSGVSGDPVNGRYCSALRSYAMCTRRMARACRGDLAYHSAVQGIEDLLIQHRCPRAGPTAQPRPLPQGTLSGDACRYEQGFFSREGRPPEYLHCSVFGDPHVRTFNDDFHTCGVEGAWPVVDNQYLYIQATSSAVRGGASATALTKITVIFKNWRQCIEQQRYQAELDDVPAAFADGSVWSGERRGRHSLTVTTRSAGRHAEISAAHIGTRLTVRQTGRSLSLALRAPRRIVAAFGPEQDLQLCVWGCPPSQRLHTPPPSQRLHTPPPSQRLHTPPPSQRLHTPALLPPALAHAHCAALLPVRDVYFLSCVFDVVATGDLNASAAALAALQDARDMMSDPHAVHLLPAASAHPARHPAPPPLLLLLLLGMLGTLTSA